VYELNINYFDALAALDPNEAPAIDVDRFLASQAIMLALIGVPGIYFHSLFGSRGWPAGVALTHRNRTVNREKLEAETLKHELADPADRRHQIFTRYAELLRARAASPAFDPLGDQQVLDVGEAVFAVLRRNPGTGHWALCVHNVSAQRQPVRVDRAAAGLPLGAGAIGLIDGHAWPGDNDPTMGIELAPYQVVWLGGQAPPAD
jgi:sucrose phosphorylase